MAASLVAGMLAICYNPGRQFVPGMSSIKCDEAGWNLPFTA